ncbi:MAG: hypothetical protein JO076_07430 [Verrucomicrobia bacterium]|nr:hypothetical protein [Verrucomicrobiota bacterium]
MTTKTNPADWSTSYSQYLARSAALSARTLNLYQLALERISQGKLPPTIFQDHFPAFAAAHTAGFSRSLSTVASRFLSNLVHLGVSFAKPDSATPEPEIIPPRFDESNPARWYEELAEYAGQLNACALKAYRTQLDRVAAGQTTPSEVQQEATERMSGQLPDFMQSMTRAYFDFLNGLNDIRSNYEETYFQGVLAKAKEDSEAPAALALTGPLGSTVTASISVTNTSDQRARILPQIFDVRRVDGVGPSVIPDVVFAPETLELDSDEEGTLSPSLQLDPAKYDVDALYAGKLHLVGASEVPLELELRILATTGAPHPANSEPPV